MLMGTDRRERVGRENESGAAFWSSAACHVPAVVWGDRGFRSGGVWVCGFSGGVEAAVVAGAAAEPDGVWKLALLGAVGVCGQSAADQPGAAGGGGMDCAGADRGAARA